MHIKPLSSVRMMKRSPYIYQKPSCQYYAGYADTVKGINNLVGDLVYTFGTIFGMCQRMATHRQICCVAVYL